jgi:predicted PurR-regulated permease PerM
MTVSTRRRIARLSPSRHPFIAIAVIAVAGAAVAILAFVLVVVPLADGIAQAPAQLGHAYQDYWDGVGQQFQQARQQEGGGTP